MGLVPGEQGGLLSTQPQICWCPSPAVLTTSQGSKAHPTAPTAALCRISEGSLTQLQTYASHMRRRMVWGHQRGVGSEGEGEERLHFSSLQTQGQQCH